MNSCDKGKRGEREFAEWLREHGVDARRGQQHCGGKNSPDVVANLPGIHLEVKFTDRLNIYGAVDQAKRDAGGLAPVVFFRSSRKEWLAIVRAEDFLKLYRGEIW